MTKQEEIREVLTTLGCKCKAKDLAKSPTGFDDEVDEAMVELDEMGVVIKVVQEYPLQPHFVYEPLIEEATND